MAEFREVLRQRKRMCAAANKACDRCVLGSMLQETGENCNDWVAEFPEDSEAFIMEWAAEHPEPKLPTWKQWQDKLFPHSDEYVAACNFIGCTKSGGSGCGHDSECINQRIPADVAEKLGIKPGEEWEDA